MSQLVSALSEGKSIAAAAVKLLGIVCLLLWVSSAAADGGSRPDSGDTLAAALQTASSEARQAAIRELKPGQVIERELAGGEAHTYRITLAAGQYLKVMVEQKGIDVVVRLFGNDGQKLAEVNNDPAVGIESLSAVAEAPGNYRLEVRSQSKDVTLGRYEIKIEEPREATAKDRIYVAAQKAFEEANQLRDQRTAEARQQAVKKYEAALPLWREAGDKRGEAYTLNEIGVIYANVGESQKALEHYGQAVQLWREVGDRLSEATALTNIGVANLRLGEAREALKYFLQALPLMRILRDQGREVAILSNMGAAYNSLSESQKALEHFSQALPLVRMLGDRRGEAIILVNSGGGYRRLGELQKALECYRQALPLLRAVGDRAGEASALHNIANLYLDLGELQKALDFQNQALTLRRAVGDRRGESYTLEGIGAVYDRSGDLQKALDLQNQALALRRAVGDRRGETSSLQYIGAIYERLGESQKALDFYSQAISLARTIGDRQKEAQVLHKIGGTYNRLGELQKAMENYRQALELSRAIHDKVSEAFMLYGIAQAERRQGNLSEGRAQVEAALNIIESIRAQVASQELRSSYLASNQSYYEFYIDLLMQMHKDQPSAGYETAALQASERSRARSLLESLTESRADVRQGVGSELLERERTARQQLSAKSEQLTRLLNGKHSKEQETAALKEVEVLLADYQEVQAQIRTKSPRYAALTQPQPLSLKEIQQQVLDADTLLLEYALGEERSYLWAVTTTIITAYELPKRAELEKLARRVYELLTTSNQQVKFETAAERRARIARAEAEYGAAAEELSKLILAPAAAQMNKKRLLIVSDGALQYLPFAALPRPRGSARRQLSNVPLIASHEVVNLPSASMLAVLRKELAGRRPARKAIAVLADPVFGKDDERLKTSKSTTESGAVAPKKSEAPAASLSERPLTRSARDLGIESEELYLPRLFFSRREAEAIVSFAPEKQFKKAMDFAANKVTATDPALSQYRYVHFATHTLLNSSNPGLSGIVLSLVNPAGDEQEGFLQAHEIYNLKLPAELVVLSSCKTGLGKEVKGEGVVGIARGFMYAGAARVAVSLWDVDDEATAEMMKRFYRAMLTKPRLSPAAALRSAQVSMWRSQPWRAPYFWAAFVLQGEYK
jgi:CHAT domain-containing protein/Flp pilus assembly protein TadD